MSDAAGLDYLRRLLGEEHVPSRLSSQSGYDLDRPSVTGVPIVPPAALREDVGRRCAVGPRDAPACACAGQALVSEPAAPEEGVGVIGWLRCTVPSAPPG